MSKKHRGVVPVLRFENETAPAGSAAANIVQLVDNFIYERVSIALIHHTKDSVQFAEAFLARRDIGRT